MKLSTILTLIGIFIVLLAAGLWMGQLSYSWFPTQAAAESKLIDDLFSFLVTLGTIIFLGVTGTIVYSILFNRAGKYDFSDGPAIEGNTTLEIVWTAIPILLVIWIAGYSYQVYEQMAVRGPMDIVHMHMPGMESAYAAPANANTTPIEEIQVTAKQWAWIFRYPNKNVITSTELHLPVNQRVRLSMRSEDVIHGFYVPAFRLKQDIVPQRTIDFEFTPIREGRYRLNDSQFSGTYFAIMQADVIVESPEDYDRWLAKAATTKRRPAYNQAFSEYTEASEKGFGGWATIPPASPPMVNQAS
ncbi:MAG: cytochrome c oxidase subunit II [Cyanobacteria bacterium CRU_2_1]|nr:cytochrome c oxidase subunit II [Cyanobacteria bacterium RU_5_0]NJR62844.1 cytochrome c oxidase subunit II [Cyanobacteria bacterium CRU_2_1]